MNTLLKEVLTNKDAREEKNLVAAAARTMSAGVPWSGIEE